ncbi:phosphatidylethanolamine N-methyltransferase /phosphatidyl-N-methylethanolamine N-methyltransferase [Rhodobacter viridis]|uniref:Phosphatidylethanolamine N-methyltransferase /phosphatidyl-N-methylethanolamine N-methyltransferase n=1 Tax=Rhodobacter viridis TaxID=1054202 RepID=A0A318U150_9RHOB|nr:class I SAM-dependent methyltransferase [Rhodobacter viridis]PYF11244.1 phosphatidylethanolamine N-methyltransferase /phosphatidyl-N-methylethanolamine N-methyltransferase [Rhodobacter viridis]
MHTDAIARSYKRWAPIYDRTFGKITHAGRHHAAREVNSTGGAVLEVGIGTGLALDLYEPSKVAVTGIDLSPDMLAKAQARAEAQGLRNVAGLHIMDARELAFEDESFDHVVALHIMSVVPEPRRVLAEMARVCRVGGTVLITNHFARETGGWGVAAKLAAPMADALGWHSDFARDEVMSEPRLKLVEETRLPPFGLMTYLRFRRVA